MPPLLESHHPKQKLLFFVAQDIDEGKRVNVREFVQHLGLLRDWLNGPPHFVNCREEPEKLTPGDIPIETLGGYLEIYSALPPLILAHEIDQQHFDEVTALVAALQHISKEQNLTFELELDRTFVGTIAAGEMDHSLAEGLLGDWQRHLGKLK